jgi:hypothetical protein
LEVIEANRQMPEAIQPHGEMQATMQSQRNAVVVQKFGIRLPSCGRAEAFAFDQ